ncbi:hypothetical protein J0A67_13385 [Algoriphagus aestuariicola]|uniref:Uncharacterized protein n=1 Tax=Algoriphagus aestuariicola TaxID=1852016 RepID=A0ABS3BUC1_9BACT|nr:hypothetical protein [Algoriphagus aestuariicola]MBN7801861.1 hypothetical protein [Algoriphagus aestuariicola]
MLLNRSANHFGMTATSLQLPQESQVPEKLEAFNRTLARCPDTESNSPAQLDETKGPLSQPTMPKDLDRPER